MENDIGLFGFLHVNLLFLTKEIYRENIKLFIIMKIPCIVERVKLSK